MKVIHGPEKGVETKLALSPESPRRFLVSLSWDPKKSINPRVPTFSNDLAGRVAEVIALPYTFMAALYNLFANSAPQKEDQKGRDKRGSDFDLDLYCYVFSADGTLRAKVGTEAGDEIDQSRKIYHSGDNTTGSGGSDEQIHVETLALPEEYKHLFFVVLSDSKHQLHEMQNITVRLIDSKTNNAFLEVSVSPSAEEKAYSFAFCQVSREKDAWTFKNISECAGDIDWPSTLAARINN